MEIRRSYNLLISTMGFPILVRHFYIESNPEQSLISYQIPTIVNCTSTSWFNKVNSYCILYLCPIHLLVQAIAADEIICILLGNFVRYCSVWSGDNFVYVPCPWEKTLQCNAFSHWLGTSTDWSLEVYWLGSAWVCTTKKQAYIEYPDGF